MGWEECSVRPTARRTPSCRPRCRSQIERRRCLKRAGDLARSCRWLWLAGGPSRRRDPRRKGLARRWCCARQVDAAGNLQVLGVLSGQHQPLYSGQPLGKAELCTVTSYVDTTMAPLIDSHRCCGPTSTRTSICPVIRQFWGSLYIDEHAWRLIPIQFSQKSSKCQDYRVPGLSPIYCYMGASYASARDLSWQGQGPPVMA